MFLKFIRYNLFFFFLFLTFVSRAQNTFPNGFQFQAIAKDGADRPAINRNIHVLVKIYENSTYGNIVYSENFKVNSNELGIFSIIIGQGNRQSGVLSLLNLD
jgi:hypothetical protein